MELSKVLNLAALILVNFLKEDLRLIAVPVEADLLLMICLVWAAWVIFSVRCLIREAVSGRRAWRVFDVSFSLAPRRPMPWMTSARSCALPVRTTSWNGLRLSREMEIRASTLTVLVTLVVVGAIAIGIGAWFHAPVRSGVAAGPWVSR